MWGALACAMGPAGAGAQALREVLNEHHVPLRGGPPDLERHITSYAVEDAGDLFVVAFYALGADPQGLADTLRVSACDRATGAWTHAYLERRRSARPAWDVGSVLEIHHTAARIYLDTHTNPSAGTIVVLDRQLRPVAALDGWLLRLLPGGAALYQHSAVHFAPTHSAELWLYDAAPGRDVRLYPSEPSGAVRQRYIDSTRALYARLGEDWFRVHNYPMDPELFDSSLEGEVSVSDSGRVLSFVMRFGGGEAPAATPAMEVLVRCDHLVEGGTCIETEVDPARSPRRVPLR